MDVDAALSYLLFVEERHRIWERRQAGMPQPWTDDPILATRKFTNVFRVLDPGSQFVLTDLLPDTEPEDFLLRCFLYRHTGNLDAWRYLLVQTGSYPRADEDLDYVLECWRDYRSSGGKVFTGAYLVYPQSAVPGTDKIESIVCLTERLLNTERFPEYITKDFLLAETQAERFNTLRRNKGVADFMSMQVLTDFGYSTEDRENEFIVPGPGCRKGSALLGMKGEDAIRWAHAAFDGSSDCPRIEVNGNTRRPSLLDVQNTLCEFSKYARFATKPVHQAPYKPAHPGLQQPPVLPALW